MTRVYKTIQIDTPVERVFDYVTTPGNWPRWHPSSLGVSGATDHLLELGERVTLETTTLEPGRLVEAKTLGNENIDAPTTGGGERQKGGVNEDKS